MPQLDSYKWKMQDNINRLMQGVVDYDQPRLRIEPASLDISLMPGEAKGGLVEIIAPEGVSISGLAVSSDIRMTLKNNEFSGCGDVLYYTFDASGLDAGAVLKGTLSLISDAGEYEVPYTVSVQHPVLEVEETQVRNLFHFANFAGKNFTKAASLYFDDKFESIFGESDRHYLNLYRGFSANYGNYTNLDSFLCAVKKKSPVSFVVTGDDLRDGVFQIVSSDSVTRKLMITRQGWGYTDITVSSDALFLRPLKTHFTDQDFVSNVAWLNVEIDAEGLHGGNNFAALTLSYQGKETRVDFCVRAADKAEDNHKEVWKKQSYRAGLVKNYIEFRIHNITKEDWENRFAAIVDRMLELDPQDLEAKLFKVHALLLSGNNEEAIKLLMRLQSKIDENDVLRYGQYLYLSCLLYTDEEGLKENCEKVRRLYYDNRDKDELLWILLYMDEDLSGDPAGQLIMLRHQVENGGINPLLYLEAYNILTKNPAMLTQLGYFELQVLNFAAKTGLFDDELRWQIVYLASRERTYNPMLVRILKALFDEFGSSDIVSAICLQLMKGQLLDDDAFYWYALAVDREINITRLYESFMYALPQDYAKELPRILQLYFRYGADLDKGRKIALYSNIIKYHSQSPEILKEYDPQIEEFTISMASEGEIDSNLAVIYRYVLQRPAFIAEFEKHLDRFAFAHVVTVNDDDFKYLVVVDSAFKKERKIPLNGRTVCCVIYSRDYELFGEYEDGRRVWGSDFSDSRLFMPEEFMRVLEESTQESLGVAVFMAEQGRHIVSVDEHNAEYVNTIIQSSEIREDYKREYRSCLLKYYYDRDKFENLDELLNSIDLSLMGRDDRAQVISLLMRRDNWERACSVIKSYGMDGVSPKVVLRILALVPQITDGIYDQFVLWLCQQCFEAGKYDERILTYLCRNAEGTVKYLRNIWKAAQSLGVDTRGIEEKALIQMLYTKAFVGEREDIYDAYEQHTALSQVEIAWVTNNAFEYVVREGIMDDRFFERLIKLRQRGLELNDLCALSVILFFSDERNRCVGSELFNDTAREIVVTYIRRFLDRKIVLKCFMSFVDLVPELVIFEGSIFIEHRTRPDAAVTIHYVLESNYKGDSGYHSENIKNYVGGLFSKRFTLFHGETLQYYISEEYAGASSITESVIVDSPQEDGFRYESRFDVLGDMLMCHEAGEDDSLVKIMDAYRRRDYISEHIFTMM